jgi:hypothetical protein
MDEITDSAPDRHEAAGYELSDLQPRPIAWFAAALAAAIIMAMAVSYGILNYAAVQYAGRQAAPSPLTHTREFAPEPRLQVNGAEDLRQMRAAEDSVLNSYGWVDRESGIVRVPVERAIEVLAQKGLPARAQGGGRQAETNRPRNHGANQ